MTDDRSEKKTIELKELFQDAAASVSFCASRDRTEARVSQRGADDCSGEAGKALMDRVRSHANKVVALAREDRGVVQRRHNQNLHPMTIARDDCNIHSKTILEFMTNMILLTTHDGWNFADK
ncbi:MAG: hypothetical protein JSR29_01400 [Nitrospira sp.]|nr:hypothetical protein [Nitrospira sp.]